MNTLTHEHRHMDTLTLKQSYDFVYQPGEFGGEFTFSTPYNFGDSCNTTTQLEVGRLNTESH